MASPQGLCHFPGVNSILSASYSLGHGITASSALVECAPQNNFVAVHGDLIWTFGGVEVFRLKGCRVDRNTMQLDDRGYVWAFSIFDRRWRWQFGRLDGHYNLKRDDGTIDPVTQKTAAALAVLCLLAMGEPAFDVSALPTDAFPTVEWEAENPAQALSNLAEQFGCRVVLSLSDVVKLVKVGVGGTLPIDNTVSEDSLTIDIPNRPDSIQCVGAKVRYETDLGLEPVGKDVDGSIRHINDLTYKPFNGWEHSKVDPLWFSSISDTPDPKTKAIPRELAKETVYRWYRVTGKSLNGTSLFLPGYTGMPVTTRARILPLEDDMAETVIGTDGKPRAKPAEVHGVFYTGRHSFLNTSVALSGVGEKYTQAFSIDRDRGIVMFQERVVFAQETDSGSGKFYEFVSAPLILRTAVSVRDGIVNSWDRYTRIYLFDGQTAGTGPHVVTRDDIQLNAWPTYTLNVPDPTKPIKSNQAACDAEADYYVNAALAEFQLTFPKTVRYAGLKLIDVDGAIQQVSWQVGPQGAMTVGSRNTEYALNAVPDYAERRAWERLRWENLRLSMQQFRRGRAVKDKDVLKRGIAKA